MLDSLTQFFARGGYLPHGFCFTWTPALLWAMVAADLVTAAAYFSIPLAIARYVRARGRDRVAHPAVAWLFAGFILACGLTHVMDVWTIWVPDYPLQMLAKVLTAAISLATALAVWPLLPRLLRQPTVRELQTAVAQLQHEVGRRRSAEQHLQALEHTLATTLGSIGAGFIATDAQGRVVRLNAVAERLCGQPQAQALGQPLWQLLPTEAPDGAALRTRARRLLGLADAADPTHPGDPADPPPADEPGPALWPLQPAASAGEADQPSWVEATLAPNHDDEGRLRGLTLVLRDVTSQREAAREQQRLAGIVESSHDAIISKTLDGRITSWNRAAQALFGWHADEILGQPVQRLIPPERQTEEMRILAELASGQRVAPFDTERLHRDGRRLQVQVTISPVRDERGRVVGGSKIARDVTAQRQAEAALRESEARLRFVLEAAQLGEWSLDLATGRFSRSARHDACFGHRRPPAEWTTVQLLDQVHPQDRAEVARGLHQACTEGRDWRAECRVHWPDGSLHWLRLHGGVRQQQGRPTHLLGIVGDISTEREAAEARLRAERLEAENRQIQEANRLKSLFLANMSHELRTPLNAVIGFADLLHSGMVPEGSPKRQQFLGHIADSGRHLLQLINDVLDLSKVESGRFEFFPEPLDLGPLVQEVCALLQPLAQRRGQRIAVQLAPGLDALALDPARLKQVLFNYLSNALKFSPEGAEVQLRARPEPGERLRIEVEDHGIGIAPEDLPRLWVEFQQLDGGPAKQHAGTGLGLALTRRLVQAQGGEVGVRSQPGVGSVFHLVLPQRPGVRQEPAPDAARAPWLLVEADGPLREAMVHTLSEAGYRVDTAATGGQAEALARQTRYHGITLRLQLPDQPALQTLQRIRSGSPSQTSPVRAVTVPVPLPAPPGHMAGDRAGDRAGDGAGSATGASAGARGASGFVVADLLSKPIRTDEVAAAIARLQLPTDRPARVLVVDDDPIAQDLMAATLHALGLRPVLAGGGLQALDEVSAHAPDLVVLDLMMPGFDGFQTLDALRRLPAGRDLPVLVWTSLLLTEAEYAQLGRSAQAVLSKGDAAAVHLLSALRDAARRPADAAPATGARP